MRMEVNDGRNEDEDEDEGKGESRCQSEKTKKIERVRGVEGIGR